MKVQMNRPSSGGLVFMDANRKILSATLTYSDTVEQTLIVPEGAVKFVASCVVSKFVKLEYQES